VLSREVHSISDILFVKAVKDTVQISLQDVRMILNLLCDGFAYPQINRIRSDKFTILLTGLLEIVLQLAIGIDILLSD
jgi:hypothetical protein